MLNSMHWLSVSSLFSFIFFSGGRSMKKFEGLLVFMLGVSIPLLVSEIVGRNTAMLALSLFSLACLMIFWGDVQGAEHESSA